MTTTKKTSKKAAKKVSKKISKRPQKADEVDPKKLSQSKAAARFESIYRLERTDEDSRASYEAARERAATAKRRLAKAEDALEFEVREQRLGPGPLFPATSVETK